MEQPKDYLTNEVISKRFDNRFDLVNYAIVVVKGMIHTGRGPRVKTETENPALQVLEEIVAGKDTFEESDAASRDESSRKVFLSAEGEKGGERSDTVGNEKSEKEKVLTE